MECQGVATSASPAGQVPAEPTRAGPPSTTYRDTGNDTIALVPGTVGRAGGGQPHDNLQPCLAIHYCIALEGESPDFG